MNYYIITGTSRGLGEAIANKLIDKNHHLFCISRTVNEDLVNQAKNKNGILEYIEYDLNDVDGINLLVEIMMRKIDFDQVESITLINNAGIVNPIKPIGKCLSGDLIKNVNINLVAPMVLSNEFIQKTEHLNCKKTVLTISSGAGKRPFYGWGAYCSSKAGVDMLTKCVGVEQVNNENPVRMISFGPGIIDTHMQQQIRQSASEDFEQVERFKKFKEEGLLNSPDFVAEKVLSLLNKKDIETGLITDIKEV